MILRIKNENLRKRFLVILIDRQIIRFFTIYFGNFQEPIEEVRHDVPQRIKTEGYSPGKIQSHVRSHLVHHFKEVGVIVEDYLKKNNLNPISGIFIGTHRNYFGQISKHFSSHLKRLLRGEFVVNVEESMGEITNKVIRKFEL